MGRAISQRSTWRWAPALCLLLHLGASPGTAGADEAELIRSLAKIDTTTDSDALERWRGLEARERIAILRRTLASEDEEVATLAALALGAEHLDVAEIRHQADLLARHPALVLEPPVGLSAWREGELDAPWGSCDVPTFFHALATEPDALAGSGSVQTLHKMMIEEHVPALAALLPQAGPCLLRQLLWFLGVAADHDWDERMRPVLARAAVYGLARLRAEGTDDRVPPLEELELRLDVPAEGGLPPTLRDLHAAFGSRDDSRHLVVSEGHAAADVNATAWWRWTGRWLRELSEGPEAERVLPAMLADPDLAAWAHGGAELLWSASQLDAAELVALREQATGLKGDAARAALLLALRGEWWLLQEHLDLEAWWRADPLYAHRVLPAAAEHATSGLDFVLEHVDRARAIVRRAQALRSALPEEIESFALSREANGYSDAERAWIAAQLDIGGAPPPARALYHALVLPSGLGRQRAAQLRQDLAGADPTSWVGWTPALLLPALAMLEVDDAAATCDVLDRWVDTWPEHRETLLLWLARLGDARRAAEIVAAARSWYPEERLFLGRIQGAVVGAALDVRIRADTPDDVVFALLAWLQREGLPEACVRSLVDTWLPQDPSFVAARAAWQRGDARESVWLAAQAAAPWTWGLLDDARSVPALRALRGDAARGQVLQAIVGLALAGDADAQIDLRAFLAEDRYFLVIELTDELWRAIASPWLVEHCLARWESNCCLHTHAYEVMRALYPNLPFQHGSSDAGQRDVEAWYRAGPSAYSRLVDGYVKSPR